MKFVVAFAAAMLPALATANCIPPWQTQFACNIPERNARAEFCRIAAPSQHPGKPELYYSFVRGTAPAELYFEAETSWFSTKEMGADRPGNVTSGVGYLRGNHVYAFFVTASSKTPGLVRGGEVRVYDSIDAFTNGERGNALDRLLCAPSSILADTDSIRP